MAASLLNATVRAQLQYTWSLVSPLYCEEAYGIYDEAVQRAIELLLCPTGAVAAACNGARMQRAIRLLRNPTHQGGADLALSSEDGPVMYLAKFIANIRGPALKGNHGLFEEHIRTAHTCVMNLLGDTARSTSMFLPAQPERLVNGTFAPFIPNSYPKGIQGAICRAVGKTKLKAQVAEVINLEGNIDTESLLHQLSVLLRSQMSRVFTCSHGDPNNRIKPQYFTAWLRYYLNLPRLASGGDIHHIDEADCAGEACDTPHGDETHLIGPTAEHLFVCVSAAWARLQLHNELRDFMHKKGIQAGVISKTEVPAKALLLHKHSEKALRGLNVNPKKRTPDNVARQKQLLDLAGRLEAAQGDPDLFAQLLQAYTEVVEQVPDDNGEVRPDVQMKGSHNQERWIDVGYVHTTKKTGRATALKFFLALPKAEQEARALGVPAAISRKASPPLESYAKVKDAKHRVLLGMAQAQVGRFRRKKPVFSACIVSHTGEWSQGVLQTIEWLCERSAARRGAAS